MKLPKIKSSRYLLIGAFVFVAVFTSITVLAIRIGQSYRERLAEESLRALEEQITKYKFEIKRLKLIKGEGEGEETIEILENGTIVRTNKDGRKTAILGFSRLYNLFGSLTREELDSLSNSYTNGTGETYTLTIETTDGEIIDIDIVIDDEDLPDEIEDIIDDIEDTGGDTFDPTPAPTPIPTTTPIPGQTPTPSPITSPIPSPTPTYPPGLPTPTPIPTPLPDYMLAPPFTCEDFSLIKDTVISNIICTPE